MHSPRLLLASLMAVLIPLITGCNKGVESKTQPVDSTSTSRPAVVAKPDSVARDSASSAVMESAPLMEAQNTVAAPDFGMKTIDGKAFKFSDTHGKVVVLNFWATWCPPCRKEIPDFIELQRTLGTRGLQIVGVSLDEGGEEPVKAYAAQMKFNYPVIVDRDLIARLYGPIQALPSTFIIDRKGNVRHFAAGALTRDALTPALEKLLAEKAS